jgi:hypothetical protein
MATVKKMQAGGVTSKSLKVGMVDPNGAWTKVQERNLPPAKAKNGACLKCGGKISKKK